MVNIKFVSVVLSILIIALLIIAGPAKAFTVGLSVLNNLVIKGEPINFQLSAEVEQGETVNIKNFTFVLEGPKNLTCDFLPNGNFINPCPEIQIQQIETTPFGYGYSYGYGYGYGFLTGFLNYNITANSMGMPAGEYHSKIIVFTDKKQFESPEVIIVVQGTELRKSCSLRATKGAVVFQGQNITSKNKLNLYMSVRDATLGQGTFTAQESRTRLSYAFTVNRALNLNENMTIFFVSETLKKNITPSTQSATILFDRVSSKITLAGSSLKVQNMKVDFEQC